MLFHRGVLAVAIASVATSVALRVWHRGGNLPGWDYLLATEGQYLIATRGWWGAIHETLAQTRDFWLPPSAYSVPYGLLPGALNLAMPWLFWQPLVVFCLWLVTLALLLGASGWTLTSARGVGLLLLAWGAWPAGLSYAVGGYPWASCVLVYALALFVVLHPRVRGSILWTTLGAAIVYELPWHSYELAKTVGCVFALAALLERDVRWPVRAVWLLAAVVQITDAYWLHETTNVAVFRKGNVGAGVGIQNALSRVPDGTMQLLRRMFVTRDVALPILTTAGVMSLFFIRKHRAFVAALWLTQFALVVMLAASGADDVGTQLDLLRSRRYLVVETVSILAILMAAHTMRTKAYGVLLALLLVGNVWSLEQLRRFTQAEPPSRFSLPAVESIETVGMVDRQNVAWTDDLASRVKSGERIILLHSQACRSEGFTNPEATLERLYLSVGHERFVRQVVALEKPQCRYVCLPVLSAQSFEKELTGLQPGALIHLDTRCKGTMEPLLAGLRARFDVVTRNPGSRYAELELRERR